MDKLFPIIRRKRRPLFVPDDAHAESLPAVAAEPVPPVVPLVALVSDGSPLKRKKSSDDAPKN